MEKKNKTLIRVILCFVLGLLLPIIFFSAGLLIFEVFIWYESAIVLGLITLIFAIIGIVKRNELLPIAISFAMGALTSYFIFTPLVVDIAEALLF